VKLIINRSQQDMKGMLGGHKGVQFTLKYRLVLTNDEAELVQRYKLEFYPLTVRQVQGTTVPGSTIGDLVRGQSNVVSDVTELIRRENVIKNACDELPVLFDVCRSFGGDEIVEYPREKTGD
jgi:hypothetical protein